MQADDLRNQALRVYLWWNEAAKASFPMEQKAISVLIALTIAWGPTASAKEPKSADYSEQISISGAHYVSVSTGRVAIDCDSRPVGNSVNTDCSAQEVRRTYAVTSGMSTNSSLRFDLVRLNWTGVMKTVKQFGGSTVEPGKYPFRFVDGNTIEILNGKKTIRFSIISTYCTQDLPGVCKAGEKLSVQ
jgi:hypothetical protein